MKTGIPGALALAGLLAVGAWATSAFAATLSRDALRNVVAACAVAKSTLNVSFPCTDVVLGSSNAEGYAVLRTPGSGSEFLVAPLNPIDGIESQELRSSAATRLWSAAWSARSDVVAALGKPLGRSALGLAVNAVGTRTQDHFHIHVDCVRETVASALDSNSARIGDDWTQLPGRLRGDRYWVRSVKGSDLAGVNVPQLMAAAPPAAVASPGSATVALVGATLADGSDGFYILANWTNSSAERLLDHSCRGR